MKSLKETVIEKIKPFIDAKRREIQNSRKGQLDKKHKVKIEESVNKINELFKELLGDNDLGPVVNWKNKPRPNNGLVSVRIFFNNIK